MALLASAAWSAMCSRRSESARALAAAIFSPTVKCQRSATAEGVGGGQQEARVSPTAREHVHVHVHVRANVHVHVHVDVHVHVHAHVLRAALGLCAVSDGGRAGGRAGGGAGGQASGRRWLARRARPRGLRVAHHGHRGGRSRGRASCRSPCGRRREGGPTSSRPMATSPPSARSAAAAPAKAPACVQAAGPHEPAQGARQLSTSGSGARPSHRRSDRPAA